MESHYRVQREERKREITAAFDQAQFTASFIGAMMDGKSKPLNPWDIYPELFREEMEAFGEAQKEIQFAAYKENRRAYAKEFNRRRRQGC